MVQFHMERHGLKTREELMFQVELAVRTKPISELKLFRREEFPPAYGMVSLLFYSGLQVIGQGPTLGRAICFASSTFKYLPYPKTPSQTHPE